MIAIGWKCIGDAEGRPDVQFQFQTKGYFTQDCNRSVYGLISAKVTVALGVRKHKKKQRKNSTGRPLVKSKQKSNTSNITAQPAQLR